MKRQAELSLLELDSANSANQVLTVIHSGKETRVTQTYGKKAADSADNGTKAAEEPTKLLTVSMPLAMFKQAITQHGLSVSKFFEDFNINLLAVNFLWSDVPLLLVPVKKFSKNIVAVVDSGSSGVVVSCNCVSCLSLKLDYPVKKSSASLNIVEKRSRDMFFNYLLRLGTP